MDEKTINYKDQAFEAYKKKNFKHAGELFSQCIASLDEQGDSINAAEMRNNLAVILLELKKPEEALAAAFPTNQIFAGCGDKKRQAMALGNIASAYQALGKNEEALSVFEESSQLFNEVGERELRSITLKKISDLQLKTGRQYQAMASLEASYDQSSKKTFKEKILNGFLGHLINKITRRS